MSTNFALMKTQYELLNHTVGDIASMNNVKTEYVEYAIENQGWSRLNMSHAMSEIVEDAAKRNALIENLAMIKEATLLPQYISVETALLAKLLEAIDSAPTELPTGAEVLERVEKIFNRLTASQGLLHRARPKDESKGGGGKELRINIMNNTGTNG